MSFLFIYQNTALNYSWNMLATRTSCNQCSNIMKTRSRVFFLVCWFFFWFFWINWLSRNYLLREKWSLVLILETKMAVGPKQCLFHRIHPALERHPQTMSMKACLFRSLSCWVRVIFVVLVGPLHLGCVGESRSYSWAEISNDKQFWKAFSCPSCSSDLWQKGNQWSF